jgi:hypothetical protein
MLQTVLAASDDVPKVFVAMIPAAVSMYRISVVETTPWDTLPFACNLDVLPGARASISMVECPATTFHPTVKTSFVISISSTDVRPNVIGGGFLPLTAQYLDPYSKRPEAAALLAGLTWIQKLLH